MTTLDASSSRPGKRMGILELTPAMPNNGPPEWPSARWVGNVDAAAIGGVDEVRLHESSQYLHARLLVRSGATVRGFVDVPVFEGRVDVATLRDRVRQLPAAVQPTADQATAAAGTVDDPPAPNALRRNILPRNVRASPPSITVIVCTRNRPGQIRTSLTAILELDYPEFDVVVVDNASATHATRDMLRAEFTDSRVTVVSEPVPGLSRARNTGLRRATGEIVAFTDDDVVVDRYWLRQLATGYSTRPDVDCVSGLVPSGELRTRVQGYFDDRVTWSKSITPRVYSMRTPPDDLPMFPFCIGEYGTGANFSLRRSAALALGGFDTAFGVGTPTGGGEDLDMFIRVLLSGRTLVVQPSAIVWHRHRDDLVELRKQAQGYGNGLGAWLTKVALNPRTLPLALARSPHALMRLISIGSRRPEVSVVESAGPPDEFDRIISRVGWYELACVASGPWLYLRQRLIGERTMR